MWVCLDVISFMAQFPSPQVDIRNNTADSIRSNRFFIWINLFVSSFLPQMGTSTLCYFKYERYSKITWNFTSTLVEAILSRIFSGLDSDRIFIRILFGFKTEQPTDFSTMIVFWYAHHIHVKLWPAFEILIMPEWFDCFQMLSESR